MRHLIYKQVLRVLKRCISQWKGKRRFNLKRKGFFWLFLGVLYSVPILIKIFKGQTED